MRFKQSTNTSWVETYTRSYIAVLLQARIAYAFFGGGLYETLIIKIQWQ